MSYELMQNKDLRLVLDLDRLQATELLKRYGRKIGNKLFIPRQELRQLQRDGTVKEFKRRPK